MATKKVVTKKSTKEEVKVNNQEVAQAEGLAVESGMIVASVEPSKETPKKLGIGAFIMEQIKLDPTTKNDDVLKLVLEKFGSKTTYACIAWYKTKMRKEGLVPSKQAKGE